MSASVHRPRASDDQAVFDLGRSEHYYLVRRLYLRRFAFRVEQAGMDSEDGLQEVYLRLLRKTTQPASRWNPERGALSTWLYVAMSGIVTNMVHAHVLAQRRNGLPSGSDPSERPVGNGQRVTGDR